MVAMNESSGSSFGLDVPFVRDLDRALRNPSGRPSDALRVLGGVSRLESLTPALRGVLPDALLARAADLEPAFALELADLAADAPEWATWLARTRTRIEAGYREDGMSVTVFDARFPPDHYPESDLFEDLQLVCFAAETLQRPRFAVDAPAAERLTEAAKTACDVVQQESWIFYEILDHVRWARGAYTTLPSGLGSVIEDLLAEHRSIAEPDPEALRRSIRRCVERERDLRS